MLHMMAPSESQRAELEQSDTIGDIDGEIGGYSKSSTNWKCATHMRINHSGEVNKARSMPHNPFVVATKTSQAPVHIFYFPKHPSEPTNNEVKPQLTLSGHDQEGFALSWSPFTEGMLLSGAADGKICLWDIQNLPKEHKQEEAVMPKQNFVGGHKGSVEAVEWSAVSANTFASLGDDGCVLLWDIREGKPVQQWQAHEGEGRCLGFNHYSEHLLATGGQDKVVAVWDLRKSSLRASGAPLAKLEAHTDEVSSVSWSPFHEDVLASCGADARVHLWDLSHPVVAEAPGSKTALVFTHAGHQGGVNEVAWSQHDEWTLASVAADASLQVWRPKPSFLS